MIVTVIDTPSMAQGGVLNSAPIQVLDGGHLKQSSFNPFDGGTFASVGKSHEAGGMQVDSTGNGLADVEIEGGETVHTSGLTGEKHIGGNLYIPGTKKKFKQAFKEIGTQEAEAEKILRRSDKLLEQNNPENKYQLLAHNSGDIMAWSAVRRQKVLAQTKEELAQTQQAIHDVAEVVGIKPKDLNKQMMKFGGKIKVTVDSLPAYREGGALPKAKDGHITKNDAIFKALEKHPERMKYVDWAKDAADRAEIPVGLFHRLLFRESGFNPSVNMSGAGAKGIAQFMPATYKGVGGNPKDLSSTSEQSIKNQLNAAAWHLRDLADKNNGDIDLAAIAYNGGQGAVNFVKRATGNKALTGADWIKFMEDRRKTHPTGKVNAWQNQTYDYVRALSSDTVNNANFYTDQFPEGLPNNTAFKQGYYVPPPAPALSVQYPSPSLELASMNLPSQHNLTPTPRMLDMENGLPASSTPYQTPAVPDNTPIPLAGRKAPYSLADSNKLGIGQFLPEIAALADRPDFVPHQRLNPHLFQPYNVSFQDRLNQNTASFKGVQNQLVNNPEALSVLAAQKYNADSSVMAEQFRTNQGIDNQITNQNIALINQTREKNLQLADQQYVRQTGAKENTRANQLGAINSISSKIGQNRLENNNIRMQESMFGYRFNPVTGQMEYVGPQASFSNSLGGFPQADPTNTTTYVPGPNGTMVPTKVVDPAAHRVIDPATRRVTRRYFGGRV